MKCGAVGPIDIEGTGSLEESGRQFKERPEKGEKDKKKWYHGNGGRGELEKVGMMKGQIPWRDQGGKD